MSTAQCSRAVSSARDDTAMCLAVNVLAIRQVKQAAETARFRIGSTLQSTLVSITNMLALHLILSHVHEI